MIPGFHTEGGRGAWDPSPQDLKVIIAIKQGLLTGSYKIIKKPAHIMIQLKSETHTLQLNLAILS